MVHVGKYTIHGSYGKYVFFTQTAAAPALQGKFAVAVDRTSSSGKNGSSSSPKSSSCVHSKVPGFRRSMCHPTFQYIFFHFSIQTCHRLWNLSVEPLNESLNTESMGSLRGTLHSTLFHIQPFAINIDANRTAWKLRQRVPLPKFPSCSVSMDVKARPGSASMAPTKEQREGCQRPSQGRPNQHKGPSEATVWSLGLFPNVEMAALSCLWSSDCRKHCACTTSTNDKPEFRSFASKARPRNSWR